MMSIHHLAAALLLFTSSINNFWKFAVFVLFLHDGCDIFLAGAKKARILRLALFGRLIYLSIFPHQGWLNRVASVYDSPIFVQGFFVATLSILMMMNIVWYWKILKIAFSGELKDTREQGK
jgi:hypothetical protein